MCNRIAAALLFYNVLRTFLSHVAIETY